MSIKISNYVSRVVCWFRHDAPEIPAESVHWCLGAEPDGMYQHLLMKYELFETGFDRYDVVLFRRPCLLECETDLVEYGKLICGRLSSFDLKSKAIVESCLAELPTGVELHNHVEAFFADDTDDVDLW